MHGEAEIENLHVTVAGQENIFRLEIAMHDGAGVRSGQPVCNRRRDVGRVSPRQRAMLHSLAQILSLEQLHDRTGKTIGHHHLVNREDRRVGQGGHRARLCFEAAAHFRIGSDVSGHHFDGDFASEAGIARAIHLTHPAGAEWRDDFVLCDAISGSERHNYAVVSSTR